VLIGARDSSWQRVYVHNQVATSQRLRLRFEGYSTWYSQWATDVVSVGSCRTSSVCFCGSSPRPLQ
jgi:hypothetical protein